MHIVFLSHEYPLWSPGGVGSFLQSFGRALVQQGHRVSVVGPGKTGREEQLEDQGVKLYRLPAKKGWKLAFWHNAIQLNKKIKYLHDQEAIDIIESAELGLAFISRKHKAQRVIRLHGGASFLRRGGKEGN